MRSCEFEDAGCVHCVTRWGGHIRGSQNHNVYESVTYPSGGARGTFCHNSGGQGECRVSEASPQSRTGHWTLIGVSELAVDLLYSFCHCAWSTVCCWSRREERQTLAAAQRELVKYRLTEAGNAELLIEDYAYRPSAEVRKCSERVWRV